MRKASVSSFLKLWTSSAFEMLNAAFSHASSSKGLAQTTLRPRRHSALPAFGVAAPGGDAAQAPQPRPAPHVGQHSHHQEGAHQKQQHQDYHQISKQWQVRRNRLTDYPAAAQAVITNSRPRREPRARAAAAGSHEGASPAALGQAKQLLDVLEYEVREGHQNCLGSSGERFAGWAERALSSLASNLADAGALGSAQRCADLAQRMQGYAGAGSLQQRAALVQQCGAVVSGALSVLQGVHPSRAERYSGVLPTHSIAAAAPRGQPATPSSAAAGAPAPPAAVDDDAFAVLAHEEETAEGDAAPTAEGGAVHAAVAAPAVVPHPDEPPEAEQAPGGRRVKPETAAFRRSFLEAALAADAAAPSRVADLSGGEQRTSEWHAMRSRRLTASAFAKTLGFFPGDRGSLWEEKVGLRQPFAGNEATRWGTSAEPRALEAYEALTGQHVEGCMFQVKHDDAPHGWLGASPDGLIAGLTITDGVPGASAWSGAALQGSGAGILEIKCPFNKGRPEEAVPPAHAIWYYMPQVQGLMDIFDREWCNLYVWTPERGSVAFLIRRDRAYWAACFDVLAEFWWAHVVPARQAHERGAGYEEVQALRPSEQHPAGRGLVEWSKRLAKQAPATVFRPLRQ